MVAIFPLLSGLLAYASFAPFGLWWCAPISLALLIHSLNETRLRKRLIATAIFGATFFGPLLIWTNTYVGDVPWILLTILQILITLPLALLPMTTARNQFLFPSIWIAVEYVRGHFPFHGFGWGRLAFSQADSPYSQLARIGGAPLLSFFVATIAFAIFQIYSRRSIRIVSLVIAITSVTLLVNISKASLPKTDYSVLAVQGGVPKLGLDFNSRATVVFENHLRATANYLATHQDRPDVILWPENAIDVDPFKDLNVGQQLQALSDKYNLPFIVGAVLQDGAHFQNASILWEPKVGPTTMYIKRHLTPFGEYIPLRGLAEIVSPYAKNVIDFLPGDRLVTHRIGRAVFAPVICFELLDDSSGRAMAKRSNVFVVQTNSATFGLTAESDQQLGITRIRAIEHQRYLVSISTSGVSAVVDPRGVVTHRTDQDHTAVIASTIGLSTKETVSDRYGAPIEATLVLFPGLVSILVRVGKRRRERHK